MNRAVVITGASTGFGAVLAKGFVAKGDRVMISARHKDDLAKTATEIGALYAVADVTKEDDLGALFVEAENAFGGVDIWINNAGVWLPHRPVEVYDMERVRGMFEVNVYGVMHGTRVAVRHMRAKKRGIIVNISSTSGLSPRPNASMYSASKWAVRGFSDSVREEVKPDGISVVTVYPGGMQTHLFDEEKSPEYSSFMTPEYVADKVLVHLDVPVPGNELIVKRPV